MGNLLSCGMHFSPSKHVVKLVHSNGLVDEFHRPVKASELTVDYPHHFILDFDSLLCSGHSHGDGGTCLPSFLAEDDEMTLGQIYFLLPRKMFDAPLSPSDIAAMASKASLARKASYRGLHATLKQLAPLPQILPPSSSPDGQSDDDETTGDAVEVKKPSSQDEARILASKEFIQKLLAETKLKLQSAPSPAGSVVPAAAKSDGSLESELQTMYERHKLDRSYAKLWWPSLDTIAEEGNSTCA